MAQANVSRDTMNTFRQNYPEFADFLASNTTYEHSTQGLIHISDANVMEVFKDWTAKERGETGQQDPRGQQGQRPRPTWQRPPTQLNPDTSWRPSREPALQQRRGPAPQTQLRGPRPINQSTTSQGETPTRSPSISPLIDFLDQVKELSESLREYRQHIDQGGKPEDLVGAHHRMMVEEQERAVINQYANLTPRERATAEPHITDAERQRADIENKIADQRRQVEEQELERRRKLNGELTRGQYALIEFSRAVSSGDIRGGLGILAGALSPLKSLAATVALSLATRAHERFEYQQAEFKQGARELSPTQASTTDVSSMLLRMERAKKTGQVKIDEQQALYDQRMRQLHQMGMAGDVSPEMWESYVPFVQLSRFFGYRDTAEAVGAGRRANQARVEVLARGGSAQEAERERLRVLNEWTEQEIKQRGGTPTGLKRDIELPGVTGGTTTIMGYREELQTNALQRQDLSSEALRMQLQQLEEIGALLTDIKNNTNGLQHSGPLLVPD